MSATIVEMSQHNVESARNASASRIRKLMGNWTENTLDLGAELARAKETFPVNPKRPVERPGFVAWAKKETGLSPGLINNLIQIHEKFGNERVRAQLSCRVMTMLARDRVPESARQEAIERKQQGKAVGSKEAKEIIQQHLPTPKEANKLAKKTNKPVLASDGYLYLGASKEEAKESEERRTVVFAVRRAVETLATIKLSPHEFLEYALPHQLWNTKEEQQIEAAANWLVSLHTAWTVRK